MCPNGGSPSPFRVNQSAVAWVSPFVDRGGTRGTVRQEMSLSKGLMIEAARLTREGRLAEASALLRRGLGLGAAPTEVRDAADSSNASETAAPQSARAEAEGGGQTPAQ